MNKYTEQSTYIPTAPLAILHILHYYFLGSNEVSFTSDGSNSTFRVMFKEPIEVQPNTNYTASATLKVRIVWKIIYKC